MLALLCASQVVSRPRILLEMRNLCRVRAVGPVRLVGEAGPEARIQEWATTNRRGANGQVLGETRAPDHHRPHPTTREEGEIVHLRHVVLTAIRDRAEHERSERTREI